MPIYEYQCQACGHRLDSLQKIHDAPLKDCPQCGTDQLKRLISAAAFRLKGGGWYETDFKSGQKKNVVEGESSGKATTTASKESKSEATAAETKPAEKTKTSDTTASSKKTD